MKLVQKIKNILYMDSFVAREKREDDEKSQRGIALIAAVAFLVMSVLNIKEGASFMLFTTAVGAILLFAGFFISKYLHKAIFLRIIFYAIFIVIFTNYTIMGGNEGFAALWLVTATYAVMISINFKAAFLIGLYYLALLLLTFIGPLHGLLQYDYNKTFLLRFPFFYAINLAFATYIIVRIRGYQYELLLRRRELEELSHRDLSTGLRNRNCYLQFEQTFPYGGLTALTAVFVDVNGLHELNNREGHDAGDRMLLAIADLCKKHFPKDSIFRMGGDEFLMVCRDTDHAQVLAAAGRLSGEVGEAGFSISYGVARQEDNFSLSELVRTADARMIAYKSEHYQNLNRSTR